MGAVWYGARANLRERIAGTLLLIVLVAVPAAIVMATVAGSLRARDALPDFLRFARSGDTQAFVFSGSVPPEQAETLIDDVVDLPDWDVVGRARPVVTSVRFEDRWVTHVSIAAESGPFLEEFERPLLLDGQLPDPDRPDEVFVNEAFADDLGLEAGETFSLRTVTPGGLAAASVGQLTRDPDGETATMTVAAIGRRPADLAIARSPTTGAFGTNSWYIMLGPAYTEQFGERLASYGNAAAGIAKPGRQDALATSIYGIDPTIEVTQGNEYQEVLDLAARGVDFEANALLLFAAVAAVTSIALVGQVLARQATFDLGGDEAFRSIGLRRAQRTVVAIARSAVVAVVAAALAAALATGLSVLFPIGIAERANLRDGVHTSPLVLAIGGAVLVTGLVGWVLFVAWRATGSQAHRAPTGRVSTLGTAAARAGAPATAVTGVRMALERGRGATAVPVVGAGVATTAGVALLSAILVFSASLDRLVATPELEGWTWDATVGNINELSVVEEVEAALRANEHVASYVGLASGATIVDENEMYTVALGRREGAAGPVALEGRLPSAADEIAFGRQTLDDLGKDIGDTVRVSGGREAPETVARIVGSLILPAALDPQLTLGRGAVMSGQGIRQVYGGEPFVPNTFLVDLTEDTSLEAGVASLREDFPETVGTFQLAEDVLNLQRVYRLPRDLAILVGAIALATLANVLFTAVRRRRRDLATLSALGFGRRQLGATVAWQATTFAVLALLVGIPVGIALGRQVWMLTVASIGLDTAPDVPLLVLTVVAAGAVLAANITALVPARSAARTRPAEILRTE